MSALSDEERYRFRFGAVSWRKVRFSAAGRAMAVRRAAMLALVALGLALAPTTAVATPPPGVDQVKLDAASGTLLVGVAFGGTMKLRAYDAASGRPRAHPFDGLELPAGAELELDSASGRLFVFVQDCPCGALRPGLHVFDPQTGRETTGLARPLQPLGPLSERLLAWDGGKVQIFGVADLQKRAELDLSAHGALRLWARNEADRRLYLHFADGQLVVLQLETLAQVGQRDFGRQLVASLVPNPFNHRLYVTIPDPTEEADWQALAYDLDAATLLGGAPWSAAVAWPDEVSGRLLLRLAADTEHPSRDRLVVMDGASEAFIAEVPLEPVEVDFARRRIYALGVGLPLEAGQVRPTPIRIVDADSLAILATTPGDVFLDGADDGPLEGGWYYKQGGSRGLGFAVRPPLWAEYQRLGGPAALGYPVSRAFTSSGQPTQVFERAVLRWDPAGGLARRVLLFDELAASDRDGWLERFYNVPRRPAWSEDGGRDPAAIRAAHLALLEADPAIKELYLSNPSWPDEYGLPMAIADRGSALVLRAQGAVFFHWQADTERGRAGEINQAPLGRVALESGWVPEQAVEPE